jgi:diguanylate cyclase (GGDEF)-like protein
MTLDVPTLFVVSTCVTGLLGLFLLFLWIKDRSVRALGWWGAAYLVGGFAVALWSAELLVAVPFPSGGSQLLLFVACGMIWNGARVFNGRRVLPLALVAGALVWLAVSHVPGFPVSGRTTVMLGGLIVAAYIVLTAAELGRDRRRTQTARWRVKLLPILHGAVFLTPVVMMLRGDIAGEGAFAVVALQTLLYVVGTAFIVVVMANERAELTYRTAASTDPLTGLLNRRGLLDGALQIVRRQMRRREAVAALMFDLDHFKSINDRFGHPTGDDALKLFAATASANMRATDLIGRIGGEEFAAIVPGSIENAVAIAERVRTAFEAAGRRFNGGRIRTTVSIGAAAAADTIDMESLLARADAVLYRAKLNGRNRTEADFGEAAWSPLPAPQTHMANGNGQCRPASPDPPAALAGEASTDGRGGMPSRKSGRRADRRATAERFHLP